jgi:hypothetical protein
MPLHQTTTRASGANRADQDMSGTIKLYRSAVHPHHWMAYGEEIGWVMFPAVINGWNERRPATSLHPKDLFQIPLWLAFNTGLLEAVQSWHKVKAA